MPKSHSSVFASFLFLATLAPIGAFAEPVALDPANLDAAIKLERVAYDYLAQAQRQVIMRGAPQRAACVEIEKLGALYKNEPVVVAAADGGEKTIAPAENASLNTARAFCAPDSQWQRIPAMMALHDEIMRLYDLKAASSAK